ncbi:MAG: hypothetical protein QOG57_5348, partial [Pseudonocardiales bacterium]|nr:hypothetical protein [Pseudonocardiales bacterium]
MLTSVSDARSSWACVALALAVAIGCWPASPARSRLSALLPRPDGLGGPLGRMARWAAVEPRRGASVLIGAVLLGALVAGPGG